MTRRHLEKAADSLGYVMRVFEGGDDLPQSFAVLQKMDSKQPF